MIEVLIRTHKVKIFKSMFNSLSFSTDPSPSESMISIKDPFSKGIGLPQTQRPRVQALTVEPVLKPAILFMIRLAKNDFPLL